MDEQRTRNIASVRIHLVMARLCQARVKRMDDILRLPISTRNERNRAWAHRLTLTSQARDMRYHARTLLMTLIERPAELHERLDGQWRPDPALEPIRLGGDWINWEETRLVSAMWEDLHRDHA